MTLNLHNPEWNVLDLLVPWNLGILCLGFLASWLVITLLERLGWTRLVWHLPLFFLALVVLITSALGFVFHP